MKFEYEIHLFEPKIETNFQFMTLEVISASSEVAERPEKPIVLTPGNRAHSCFLGFYGIFES